MLPCFPAIPESQIDRNLTWQFLLSETRSKWFKAQIDWSEFQQAHAVLCENHQKSTEAYQISPKSNVLDTLVRPGFKCRCKTAENIVCMLNDQGYKQASWKTKKCFHCKCCIFSRSYLQALAPIALLTIIIHTWRRQHLPRAPKPQTQSGVQRSRIESERTKTYFATTSAKASTEFSNICKP